jgi:monofunctional biosynthetic peptidoglycan transglycosylase
MPPRNDVAIKMDSDPAASARPKWPVWRRLAVLLVLLLAVILVAPYLIMPLYRVVDPISVPMLWRFVTGARVTRTIVPLTQMTPVVPRSVIASEDGQFCFHRGIDLGEMRAALEEGDGVAAARGASTITQQTVKNLFLWGGRSVVRKVLEIPLAVWMSLVLPKRRVLEIYLNIAEWGPDGQFGAEAGARYAFGKSTAELSAQEAALLATVLPNPHRRSARSPGPAVRRVAGVIERRATRVATPCLRSASRS